MTTTLREELIDRLVSVQVKGIRNDVAVKIIADYIVDELMPVIQHYYRSDEMRERMITAALSTSRPLPAEHCAVLVDAIQEEL